MRTMTCHACGIRGRLPDSFTGSKVRCPSCRAIVAIGPEPDRPAPPVEPAGHIEIVERRPRTRPASPGAIARPDPPPAGAPAAPRRLPPWWKAAAAVAALVPLTAFVTWLAVRPAAPAPVETPDLAQAGEEEIKPVEPPRLKLKFRAGDGNDVPAEPAEGAETIEDAGSLVTTRDAAKPPAPTTAGRGPTLTTEEIVERCEDSVALVRGKVSSGTGFIVGRGLLVTNAHVVEDEFARNLRVSFPSVEDDRKGPIECELLYEDRKRDLAFLRIASPLPPLEVASTYTFRRGQDVTAIGSPGFGAGVLENAVSRGVMSSRAPMDGLNFYQLSISINPGNSGGPVFDSTGKVVGVATLKASQQEGIAFCIPADELQTAISAVSKQTPADAETTGSKHRAGAVVRFLGIAGKVYESAMNAYVSAMMQAMSSNLNARVGIDAASEVIEQKLGELDKTVFADIDAEADQVIVDPAVSQKARRLIQALAANYHRMREMISSPGGTATAFRARSVELGRERVGLLREVGQELNIEVPDEIVARLIPPPVPGQPPRPGMNGPDPRNNGRPRPRRQADGARPADDPQGRRVSLTSLKAEPNWPVGIAAVRGTIRNDSDGPITSVVAVVQVRGRDGTIQASVRGAITPNTIEPGREGSFSVRPKALGKNDSYHVIIMTVSGQVIDLEGARKN